MSQTATTRSRRQFRLKPGTVLGLGLVLIVAIGLAIYFRPPKPLVPSVDRYADLTSQAVAAPTVLELESDDLTHISFQRDTTMFSLERIDGEWHITSPFTDRADDEAVAALVDNLAGIAFDLEVESFEGAAEYGLDEPIITASFTDNSGKEYTMAIAQPEGSVEWFIQTSEVDTPYLVRNLPDLPFSVIAGELIYGQLLDFNPADISRITAITPNFTRVIEAEGPNWFADTDLGRGLVFDVNTFLRDLYALTGSSIAATADQNAWDELGLSPIGETMHIELQTHSGAVHTLDVGGTADGRRYFVRSSDRPHAYVVVEFSAINLDRKLAQATTDVLSVNLDRVNNVKATTVNADGTVVERTFQRDNEQKQMWQSERRVAFYVASLLETVNGVTAFQIAPEASADTYGFHPNPDSLSLQLTMENRAVHTLDIGNKTADGQYTYVRTSMRPGVYLASNEAADSIRAGLGVIRTTLLPFDVAKVTEIELIPSVGADGTDPDVYVLARSGDGWTRNGVAIDSDAVDALITQLTGMQAETIPPVAPEEEYQFYPAADSTRVVIRTTDADDLIFDIGAPKQSGVGWFSTTSYYVRVSDLEEIVFISERNARDIRNAINAAAQ